MIRTTSTMSLSLLMLAALVAGTQEYRNAVLNEVLRFEPHTEPSETPTKPEFCKSLECPLYTVVKKTKKYELREYDTVLWVQTRETGMDYSRAQYTNFMKLFRYIQGANVKKQKIPMTVPVINKILPGEGPACESDFTMSFFLTQRKSDFRSYPGPTNTEVKITPMQKFRVYVREFSGYVTRYDAWRRQAEQLITDIGDSSKYHQDMWYTAGYDSPFTIFNRHNEIWFMAK